MREQLFLLLIMKKKIFNPVLNMNLEKEAIVTLIPYKYTIKIIVKSQNFNFSYECEETDIDKEYTLNLLSFQKALNEVSGKINFKINKKILKNMLTYVEQPYIISNC